MLFVALSKLMFSSGVKPVQAEQLPVKRITELKAAHKASRQRYKFNVKKQKKTNQGRSRWQDATLFLHALFIHNPV